MDSWRLLERFENILKLRKRGHFMVVAIDVATPLITSLFNLGIQYSALFSESE